MPRRFIVATVGVLSLAFALPVIAQQPDAVAVTAQSTQALELTTTQRSQIAESIISRWMGQVLKSPAGDVKAWSAKLRTVIATADSANVLRASQMPSLDLVHAALVGGVVDDAAIKAALSGTASANAPQALGAPDADTTYTPLPNGRCRVASSLAISSPLPAGETRLIDTEGTASYADQGGVGSITGDGSANCGIPNLAAALAVSVSARTPSADGVMKVFAANRPNAAGNTIPFYVSAKGGAADLIVESCRTCLSELAILSTAQTHYIIDVIGYFMPPEATALECIYTSQVIATVSAGTTGSVTAPICPGGYTGVSTSCQAPALQLREATYGRCSAINTLNVDAIIFTSRQCCRVPGR